MGKKSKLMALVLFNIVILAFGCSKKNIQASGPQSTGVNDKDKIVAESEQLAIEDYFVENQLIYGEVKSQKFVDEISNSVQLKIVNEEFEFSYSKIGEAKELSLLEFILPVKKLAAGEAAEMDNHLNSFVDSVGLKILDKNFRKVLIEARSGENIRAGFVFERVVQIDPRSNKMRFTNIYKLVGTTSYSEVESPHFDKDMIGAAENGDGKKMPATGETEGESRRAKK